MKLFLTLLLGLLGNLTAQAACPDFSGQFYNVSELGCQKLFFVQVNCELMRVQSEDDSGNQSATTIYFDGIYRRVSPNQKSASVIDALSWKMDDVFENSDLGRVITISTLDRSSNIIQNLAVFDSHGSPIGESWEEIWHRYSGPRAPCR